MKLHNHIREDDPKLREKDLYVISYSIQAFIAGPVDKYVDRPGPFGKDIDRILNEVNEFAAEQGILIPDHPGSLSFINDGIITPHFDTSYHMLNCILSQSIDGVCGFKHEDKDLVYQLIIMGRERPVNNLVTLLQEERLRPNPFNSKPSIKRYGNVEYLRPQNFSSIQELEEKLSLVATMEPNRKVWEWHI
jgi:hypothetical protein